VNGVLRGVSTGDGFVKDVPRSSCPLSEGYDTNLKYTVTPDSLSPECEPELAHVSLVPAFLIPPSLD
jgi:hypothetical protein